jgi:hypothetical protein
MAVIPYALTFTTSMRGRASKHVSCENCSFEYVYIMEATASGEGTSLLFLDNTGARQRAAERAGAALHEHLAQGCEVVPCPPCGAVQQHMLPRARELHLRWMRKTGLIVFAVAGILSIPATVYALVDLMNTGFTALTIGAVLVVVFLVGLGGALIIQRRRLCRRYDPNRLPIEDRKRLGQQLAVSKEDFLKTA